MKLSTPSMLFLLAIFTLLATPRTCQGQYLTPVQDGVISTGEYGNAQNQLLATDFTWYMTWDANYIYVAVTGSRLTLPAAIFFDSDPTLPVNTSSGTLSGITYTSGSQQATITPPFQADRAFFFDNDNISYYAASSSSWSGAVTIGASPPNPAAAPAIADLVTKTVGQASVRELRIARSTLNLSSSGGFNWLGYIIYSATGNLKATNGSVPITNEGGYLATGSSLRYAANYYTVSQSGDGTGATKPFSQISYMAPSAAQASSSTLDLGSLTVYDFALNSAGLTIRNTGVWTINGSMMLQQGTLDMNSSSNGVTVKHDLMIRNGATFKHSTANSNLTISGNFSIDDGGTFTPGTARVTLDGTGSQNVPKASYYNLFIPGTGTKTLAGDITILSSLNLTGGLLETGGSKVILAVSPTNPSNIVLRETGTGYVRGMVQATGDVPGPGNYHFGGIGLILAPGVNTTKPGVTTVTRYTGGYKTGAAFGPGNNTLSQSALRQFLVQPTVFSGLNYKLIFAYRDADPSEINYNYTDNSGPKSYSMHESDLELFRTTDPTGNGTWQNLHATTRDTVSNDVTVTGITDFTNGNFFTLAAKGKPLPVALVSFTARAVAAGVQLNWSTASEITSQGFAIERRAPGETTFQELKFVASQGSPTRAASYSYLDAAVAPGTWYYRLRQRDTDGTESLLPVAAVTVRLSGVQAIQLSPVPTGSQLTIRGLEPNQQLVVLDALGRQVLSSTARNALTTLRVAHLPAGMYTVRVLGMNRPLSARFMKE